MPDLSGLRRVLFDIDSELRQIQGNTTEQQANLLRHRREVLLAIKDAEKAQWGD